jgi:ADP-ribosylglycohydrolase
MAFLEGNSFLDVISCAISIGGDSDTIAAISGSLAEVIYPIPHDVREEVLDRVDAPLLRTIAEAVDFCYKRNKRE